MGVKPYNPLSKKNLGLSVAWALLDRELSPLPPDPPPIGAGIYALYYRGDFPLYEWSVQGHEHEPPPIYVGRAQLAGRRTGQMLSEDLHTGTELKSRLQDHAKSISDASNLDLQHFYCRYLVVDDVWISLAESLLIHQFRPLWNVVVDGFGNHAPGRGRRHQARSDWDVLHPGRSWASHLADGRTSLDVIESKVRKHLIEPADAATLHPDDGG